MHNYNMQLTRLKTCCYPYRHLDNLEHASNNFYYHASDNYFKKIAQTHQLVIVESNETTLYRLPIEEPKASEIDETDETEFAELRERSKAFESSALCKLIEIFGEELTIQEEDI